MTTPSESPPPVRERRASLRYACSWQAFCQSPEQNWWRWARVQDVSSSGVQVLTNHPFENGSLLDLDLEVCGFILPVSVTHVTPQPDGYWLIGCKFADGLRVAESDLQTLLRKENSR